MTYGRWKMPQATPLPLRDDNSDERAADAGDDLDDVPHDDTRRPRAVGTSRSTAIPGDEADEITGGVNSFSGSGKALQSAIGSAIESATTGAANAVNINAAAVAASISSMASVSASGITAHAHTSSIRSRRRGARRRLRERRRAGAAHRRGARARARARVMKIPLRKRNDVI